MISSQPLLLCIHFIFLLQNITCDTLYHAVDYKSINFLTKWIRSFLPWPPRPPLEWLRENLVKTRYIFFICHCSGEKPVKIRYWKFTNTQFVQQSLFPLNLTLIFNKKYTKNCNFHLIKMLISMHHDYYLHLKLTAILKIHKEFSVWWRRRFWCHCLSVKQKFPLRL